MGYPIQMREAVLKSVLKGSKPHHEIAVEFGVGRSTIGKWLREHKLNGNIKLPSKEKRPKDWTAEERMSALLETGSMTDEERTVWCRKNGIFFHNLDQWKKDAISAMKPKAKEQAEKESNLKKEILSLKKDLSRKEKALAETAALLVLKKKAQEIWGEPKDD